MLGIEAESVMALENGDTVRVYVKEPQLAP